jgi:hypothetical protein
MVDQRERIAVQADATVNRVILVASSVPSLLDQALSIMWHRASVIPLPRQSVVLQVEVVCPWFKAAAQTGQSDQQ